MARRSNTTEAVAKEAKVEEAPLTMLQQVALRAPVWGAAIGGALVVYGITKSVMWITSSFMHVNFSTVGFIGFAAGFLSASLCAGGAYATYRFLTIRPEFVYRKALSSIGGHEISKEVLGGTVHSGSLRAYTLRTGGVGLNSERRVAWLWPRVQMIFQVEGDVRTAMATVEAEKRYGNLELTLLTIDVMDVASHQTELMLLEGSKERLKVRGQLRGFLQSERVKYMDQDVPDSFNQVEKEIHDAEA